MPCAVIPITRAEKRTPNRQLKKPHMPNALSIVEGCAQSPDVGLEYWSLGVLESWVRYAILQYSNIPLLQHSDPFVEVHDGAK
jgi:hypothetical protein